MSLCEAILQHPFDYRDADGIAETEQRLCIWDVDLKALGHTLESGILPCCHVANFPLTLSCFNQKLFAAATNRCSQAPREAISSNFSSAAFRSHSFVYGRITQRIAPH